MRIFIKCAICNADPIGRWVQPPMNVYIDRHRTDSGSRYHCHAHLSPRRQEELRARGQGRQRSDLEKRCGELEEEIGALNDASDELEEDLDQRVRVIAGFGFELTDAGDMAIVDRDLAVSRFNEMLAELGGAKWHGQNPPKSV